MKRIFCLLLILAVGSGVYAQDVYNSSGGVVGYRHKKPKKGYDPSKLIIGGGINFGYSTDYANFGVSPMIGYRFTEQLSAGVGVGYQFYKELNADVYYTLGTDSYIKENIVYPSIWGRYQVYHNWFVDGDFEYNFINVKEQQIKYDAGGNPFAANASFNANVPCLLLGVGYRQQLGGRLSFFLEGLYDVLQQEYSPYYKLFPVVRVGFTTGL